MANGHHHPLSEADTVPSLERLSESARQGILSLAIEDVTSTPFHRPAKPLAQSRVAIVTTAGVHLPGERPFVAGDPTYRMIPSDTDGSDLLQSHTSLGFDRTGIMADPNVVYPIDRLREMVAEGKIGELAPRFYSFMGAQRDVAPIKTTMAPEVAAHLLEDGVDVVLLTPT